MAVDAQLILSVAVPAVGVVVWLLRLEGRVNTHDVLQKSMKEDIEYIRDRIDRALNGHHD